MDAAPGRRVDVLVVGAGPCGLACARELSRNSIEWEIVEASDHPGGLASSVTDPAGFTWDLGGHVVFSHYGAFDELLHESMGNDLNYHERSSYIRSSDAWVPYPFQNNLHRLGPERAAAALAGLIEAQTASSETAPPANENFASWMNRRFGPGVVEQFMRPYNEKVWAHPAEMMSSAWIAERVSVVDWRTAVQSTLLGKDHLSWGPNNLFAYPKVGGTGEIYRRLAATLPGTITYNAPVVSVDATKRLVQLRDGTTVGFGAMVWTGPLDHLVAALVDCPPDVRDAAGALIHNRVTVVGIGYDEPLHDDRSWLYFPDDNVPFYRATNMAKYSAQNVPGGDTSRFSSFMTEVASSEYRPLTRDGLERSVDRGLRSTGLVSERAKVVSAHCIDVPYAYPVPTLGRDRALSTIQPWLMDSGIRSRGRFGAWRYEWGNMDHAVKMGADVARSLADGTEEELWHL